MASPVVTSVQSPTVRNETIRRRSILKDNMMSIFRSPTLQRRRVTIVEPSDVQSPSEPASPVASSRHLPQPPRAASNGNTLRPSR